MKRRTYLATVAAVTLAGCTGAADDNDSPPTTEQSTDGTTDDGTTADGTSDDETSDGGTTADGTNGDDTFGYAFENVQTDTAPVDDVTIDVTITENFSTDHPARLEVAFTNEADEARTFMFGSLVPWDGIRGQRQDGTASLLLSPGDNVVPEEPTDDCWQATDGVALPTVMREETLDPDETASREFRVVAAHDSENCHPVGTYRFEDGNYLGEGWGFEVDVVAGDEN